MLHDVVNGALAPDPIVKMGNVDKLDAAKPPTHL